MLRHTTSAVCVLILSRVAAATPIPVTMDPNQSSVTVAVSANVSGIAASDQDTSRVGGVAWIKLQPLTPPATIGLRDFHFDLLDPIDLTLTFRLIVILGEFDGHTRAAPENVKLDYPPLAPPQPPTPVAPDGAFVYTNVPQNLSGLMDYTATGAVCTVFQNQVPPRPCVGALDLTQQGTTFGTYAGSVTVSPARGVSLVLNPSISGPIDPADPSLGTLTTTGTIRGFAMVPLRGDADLSGNVDGGDIETFVAVLINPGAFGWEQQYAVDMNDDDLFDASDAQALVDCLLGGVCPT